jgi:quercetin dioxygenase-like cupin family protein
MIVKQIGVAFEDERGTIQDLVEDPGYAVTIVQSRAGAVRGNHLHKLTSQWAYVLSGRMLVSTGEQEAEVDAGELVFNPLGEPHAWRALEDTVCVVFALGPRAGRNYESDTYRLAEPLLA